MILIFLSQGKTLAEQTQGMTTNINGEEVILEAPVKAGETEARETQAPKEELGQNDFPQLRSRMAARALAPQLNLLAVYRMYNVNSGEHFYTENSYERDSLKKIGWNYEGIGWQAPENGPAVYRLYNPNAKVGSHHFTMSSFERDSLIKAGWKNEGIAFNAYTK